MHKIYSDGNITWSSIEKDVLYSKAIWCTSSDGIPRYAFFDENGNNILKKDN